jgi:hypothetical protein
MAGNVFIPVFPVLSNATIVAALGYTPVNQAGDTMLGDLKFTDGLYDIGKSGATRPRDGFFSRNLAVGGSVSFPFGSRFTDHADGVITAFNAAGTGVTRINLGGTDANFPALVRNVAGLDVKLADNSAYTSVRAATFQADLGQFRGGSATILNLGTNGLVLLTNSAATAGVLWDLTTDATAKLRNRANNADGALTAGAATLSGDLTFSAAATGPILKQGANGRVGTFVCNGASAVTVNNTSIAVSDAIIVSLKTVGGTVGAIPAVKTITAGTGFTIAGTASDTSTYNYAIIKNAA